MNICPESVKYIYFPGKSSQSHFNIMPGINTGLQADSPRRRKHPAQKLLMTKKMPMTSKEKEVEAVSEPVVAASKTEADKKKAEIRKEFEQYNLDKSG